jgi:hypothetical protein
MKTLRIDHLRSLVEVTGDTQRAYIKFFSEFADRLETALGEYLGSTDSVALCNAHGHFTFAKGSYRHEGLGFDQGRFRIPFMFHLKNLKDDGSTTVRVRLHFTKKDTQLSVRITDEAELYVDEGDMASLTEYVYGYLCKVLATPSWIDQNKADYQNTNVGFTTSL